MRKKFLAAIAALTLTITTITGLAVDVKASNYEDVNYSREHFDYVINKEAPMTRWIGRGNDKATNFLANCGSYDRVLYLSDTLTISTIKAKSAVSSNKKVIKVEDGKLIPVSQGKATVTYKLKDGTKKKEVIAVTTFNDGKNPKTAHSFSEKDWWAIYSLRANPEHLKRTVHTIQDAIFAIEVLDLKYDFAKDDYYSKFQYGDQDLWMATATGPTVIERGGGVCRSAAEIGLYLLQDDFEDAGCIFTKGEVGHIFNWFYEDGKYIIVDFTRVFDENAKYQKDDLHWAGMDYWKQYINSYDSIEALKKDPTVYSWVNKNGNMNSLTWVVGMYSALGHDCSAIMYDEEIHNMRNAQEKKSCTLGFQKEVYDRATILFKKNGWNIKLKSFNYKDLRYDVQLSNRFYGYRTEIVPW